MLNHIAREAWDMLMHRIVDVWCCVGTSLHPQRDRCHGITTANQKSVKNWSSEYIGGVPTALMCYPHHPVCTILSLSTKKTKEQRVVERRSSWFIHSRTAATRPQPIERASNTDLVTVLAVYQEYHYSPMMILMKPRVWSLLKRWFVVLGFPFIIVR